MHFIPNPHLAVGALATAGSQAARNLPNPTSGFGQMAYPVVGAILSAFAAGSLYDPNGNMSSLTTALLVGTSVGLATTSVSDAGSRATLKQYVVPAALGTLTHWALQKRA